MTSERPDWLGDCRPELVRDYLNPDRAGRAEHLNRALARCGAAGAVFVIGEAGAPRAVAGVERLAWDSAHFGFGCARLAPVCIAPHVPDAERFDAVAASTELALDWCRKNGIATVLRRLVGARSDEARILEDRGFRLMDSIVTFTASPAPAKNTLREAAPADREPLLDIARTTFPYSRFLADPAFDPVKARDVYVRWLETLLARTASGDKSGSGSIVLVAEADDVAAGFVSVRRDESVDAHVGQKLAMIEMIAVAAGQRGQGLGGDLLKGARDWAARQGADLVEASTWTAAAEIRRFYARENFSMRDVLLTFHGRTA
jgi:GNAT superfamily N-acetyltransferase